MTPEEKKKFNPWAYRGKPKEKEEEKEQVRESSVDCLFRRLDRETIREIIARHEELGLANGDEFNKWDPDLHRRLLVESERRHRVAHATPEDSPVYDWQKRAFSDEAWRKRNEPSHMR